MATAAEDEEALRLLAHVEGLVAGEVADVVQPRDRDVVGRRAGGDDKLPGLNDVVAGLDLLRREEAGARFVEREAAVAQLLAAIGGKVGDQPRLALDDGG